ncbi:FAD-binding domain-containing protein [Zopfia rhizophila CBS 207.26]|uniref:FAD-binding domain-containing protein n=1 Tax=Zopfia rhizophila CBS 207.26 TaxID=1314779 RepID=A0A6A6DUC9_9PEZI|nr:FAD-binding domain-containing protein [Zopfia rhizophila CBS 207.26]
MVRIVSSLSAILLTGLAYADTCSSLEDISIDVSRPLELSYITEQNEYWSTSCSALKPSCIIFPKTAAEVATIVEALNNNTENFAIKSGGHNPNNYFASVEGGPLISTQKLDQVLLDQETGIVRVGPGNRLDGLAAKLDGTGWTFVGGRIGNTGVGGLVLGGGLSYMSAQYGWSASSVLEYEVVLANGTIVTVSATKSPDLFKALKGGGNNFGIVTSYLLQAYRQGDIYGGNLAFLRSEETDAKLLKAVRDFTEYNEDHKAAVIVTAERAAINLVDSWIVFLFYDGVDVPEETFKNFTDIGPTLNTCKVRSYADLMASSNWVIVEGSIVTIGTETIPLPSVDNGKEVMDALHAHWRNVSGTVMAVPGIVASIAYQPFPKRITQAARERSNDLIDCDDKVHRMIIEMNYSFFLPSDYEKMGRTLQETYTGIRERVLGWQEDGTLENDVYLPIFMNYGFYRQDYFSRLRPENAEFARSVAMQVDPEGLFRNRTGGWKP